ncbi:MAG: Na+/H+ antiporter subunit E [Betaproteobacteria bacterium]|nr:Na+/H+ antiporter subunit E [Betaproteobacteria bacterium]
MLNPTRATVLYAVSSAITLFAFWLLLSGYFTPFLLVAGIASAVAITAFGWRMDLVDHEGHPVHLGWRSLIYWPWLVKEIVLSALAVSRIILERRLPISPTLVRVKPSQKTTVGVVTYANSITLTPGTVSVEVSTEEILVHALTREGAESLAQGDMDRRVSQFEGGR